MFVCDCNTGGKLVVDGALVEVDWAVVDIADGDNPLEMIEDTTAPQQTAT